MVTDEVKRSRRPKSLRARTGFKVMYAVCVLDVYQTCAAVKLRAVTVREELGSCESTRHRRLLTDAVRHGMIGQLGGQTNLAKTFSVWSEQGILLCTHRRARHSRYFASSWKGCPAVGSPLQYLPQVQCQCERVLA